MQNKRDTFNLEQLYLIGLWAVLVISIVLNLSRISYNNFWYDECHSIHVANLPLNRLLTALANDAHPPFYFLFLWALIRILGSQPWVFHLASFIPYLAMMILDVIFVRKKYGNDVALLLGILLSFLQNSYVYIMEVRSYELDALGLMIAFLAYYCILEKETFFAYAAFAFGSLLSVYSHYVTVFSAAPLYILLLIYSVKKGRNIKRVLCLYFCTVIAYLPWIFKVLFFVTHNINYEGLGVNSSPALKWLLVYYFNTNNYFAIIMLLLVLAIALYLSIRYTKGRNEKDGLDAFWIISGIIATFIPLIMFEVLAIFRGAFVVARYLYPASVLLWISLAVGAGMIKHRHISLGILILVTLVVCGSGTYKDYYSETLSSQKCLKTQEFMKQQLSEDDIVITNFSHLAHKVVNYYLPKQKCEYVVDRDHKPYEFMYSFDYNTSYWAVWRGAMDENDIEWLSKEGYTMECVLSGGVLGETEIYLYRLIRMKTF